MRVLGIDPGSTATGYGVVERRGARVIHRAHGTVRAARGACLAERLACIHARLIEVIRDEQPDLAVVERVFASRNLRSALVLGQARGVALAAAAGQGLTVDELSAQEIKQAVTGTGAADKAQVQAMVSRLLGLDRAPAQDAADALAAALCRAHQGPLAASGGLRAARTPSRRGAGRRRDGPVVRRAR